MITTLPAWPPAARVTMTPPIPPSLEASLLLLHCTTGVPGILIRSFHGCRLRSCDGMAAVVLGPYVQPWRLFKSDVCWAFALVS